MRTTDLLTVSEVARRSGFAPSALRFYEREGLVHATRTGGNQRRYERGVLRRLAFIRAARNVGLSLDEVKAALATLPDGRTPTRSRLDPALAHLARAPRRPDRGPAEAARRARLVHRLRLPVAQALRDVRIPATSRPAPGRARSTCPLPCAAAPPRGDQDARPSMTSAAGSSASSADGNAIFERRRPLPMTTVARSRTAASTSTGHSARQPDRRDAAVLHAGQRHGVVHRRERRLARVEALAHHAVHVGPRRRQHHARGVAGHVAAAPGDDHAVRRVLQRHAVLRAERGGVGELRIDRGGEHLALAAPGREGVGDRSRDEFGRGDAPFQGSGSGHDPNVLWCVMDTDATVEKILRGYDRITVVGASDAPDKPAHYVPAHMREHGWTIVPVNPRGGTILGETAYPSLADVPAAGRSRRRLPSVRTHARTSPGRPSPPAPPRCGCSCTSPPTRRAASPRTPACSTSRTAA